MNYKQGDDNVCTNLLEDRIFCKKYRCYCTHVEAMETGLVNCEEYCTYTLDDYLDSVYHDRKNEGIY